MMDSLGSHARGIRDTVTWMQEKKMPDSTKGRQKEDIYSKMGNQFGVRGEQTPRKSAHESHFHYRAAMNLRF